ncbi:MAG: anti-sigma factor [Burkholderiales bacterium]|nr:anti-sigma factor [Burkholderiales bacterium]
MTGLPPELKQHMTAYQAPPGLKRRIRYMLEQQARSAAPVVAAGRRGWLGWLPLGASFAGGAVLAVSLMSYLGASGDEGLVEQQVVAGHVRSLMAAHLTDVASTDQHTVKPWFTGKLDYAPPVIDLAGQGFALAGGRLDYLQGRPVAALVYQRRGHTINVFVLPSGRPGTAAATLVARQGWLVAGWTQAGMHFWAVSDVGREDLAKFAAQMQAANPL